MRAVLGLLLAGMFAATPAVLAHHSFAATYDATKRITLSGVVTRVEFRNPHIWVFFDVKGEDGVTNWGCEGAAPNALFRRGWRPDTLKPGEPISVEGFAARSGKPICNMRVMTRATDGWRVFAGANDGGPSARQPGGAR